MNWCPEHTQLARRTDWNALPIQRRALVRLGLAGSLLLAGAAGIVAAVRPGAAYAHDALAELPGITVLGEGAVAVRPDAATLRLGVEANAPSPAGALTQAQQGAERVLQRLRNAGVAESDVQTGGLNVFPIQMEGMGRGPAPSGPGAPPAPATVYRGSVSITVRVRDASRAGQLLDVAIQAGATSVSELTFGAANTAALRREALAVAIRDARPKAEAAAAAAGLTLGGVRSVVEQPYGGPRLGGAGGMGGGAAEGIAPGQLEVATQAQVTYDVVRPSAGASAGAGQLAPTVGTASVPLEPVGRAAVSGTVTARGTEQGTTLVLIANGLEPGVTYRAQLQVRGAASFGTLGELVADTQGRAQLTATEARVSASGAPTPLDYVALVDGEHVISVVLPGTGVVAEAVVPRA